MNDRTNNESVSADEESEALLAKLRALHSFPCEYPFKLIGINDPSLQDAALEVLRALIPDREPAITRRESEHGKHQSLTLTVVVETPEVILGIYARLRTIVGVHMLL